MRVAVAGAGAFGRNHLRVYRELETSELPVALVAAVEPNESRASETAAKYSIPVFASVEELLKADLRLDAASVAVPTVRHHVVASVLLDAGLDLLVEKPLAATLVEADELLALLVLLVPLVEAVVGLIPTPAAAESCCAPAPVSDWTLESEWLKSPIIAPIVFSLPFAPNPAFPV